MKLNTNKYNYYIVRNSETNKPEYILEANKEFTEEELSEEIMNGLASYKENCEINPRFTAIEASSWVFWVYMNHLRNYGNFDCSWLEYDKFVRHHSLFSEAVDNMLYV